MSNQSAADAIRELLARNPELGVKTDVSATVEERDPLEHAEQCAVVDWAKEHESQYPELGTLYAVPNGGYRHPSTAANMKAEGQRPGVPDLCAPFSRTGPDGRVHHALYVEMKRIGGILSTVLRNIGNAKMLAEARKEVGALCDQFPLYPERIRENR